MPPVLGWASMTGDVGPEALILFLIIFLWTPPFLGAGPLPRRGLPQVGPAHAAGDHGNAFTRLQVFPVHP